jgi:hypothetical protein
MLVHLLKFISTNEVVAPERTARAKDSWKIDTTKKAVRQDSADGNGGTLRVPKRNAEGDSASIRQRGVSTTCPGPSN